jgi:peptidylprolyl isomerase
MAVPAVASAAPPHHHAAAKSSGPMPTVTGGYGIRPKLTFPHVKPPNTLEVKVLHKGNGPVVRNPDLIVCNYYGQVWRGKVFDTSFGRGLFPTPIGVGAVIPGWDKGLVGVHAGSRVLLVIPAAEGYGKSGQPSAGIPGNATLAFVIDVVGVYNHTVHGDVHATVLHKTVKGITVSGKLGQVPTIKVTPKTPEPKSVTLTVLDRGHGPKLKPGVLVDQYVAESWQNTVSGSTYTQGFPDGETIPAANAKSALSGLVGVPLGSRVLIELPKSANGGPFAIVMDVIAQPHEPKG